MCTSDPDVPVTVTFVPATTLPLPLTPVVLPIPLLPVLQAAAISMAIATSEIAQIPSHIPILRLLNRSTQPNTPNDDGNSIMPTGVYGGGLGDGGLTAGGLAAGGAAAGGVAAGGAAGGGVPDGVFAAGGVAEAALNCSVEL